MGWMVRSRRSRAAGSRPPRSRLSPRISRAQPLAIARTFRDLLVWQKAHRYLGSNATWGRANFEAWQAERSALDIALAKVKERGGRVYPGPAAGWGSSLRIGSVPFYAFLSDADVPAVAFLY